MADVSRCHEDLKNCTNIDPVRPVLQNRDDSKRLIDWEGLNPYTIAGMANGDCLCVEDVQSYLDAQAFPKPAPSGEEAAAFFQKIKKVVGHLWGEVEARKKNSWSKSLTTSEACKYFQNMTKVIPADRGFESGCANLDVWSNSLRQCQAYHHFDSPKMLETSGIYFCRGDEHVKAVDNFVNNPRQDARMQAAGLSLSLPADIRDKNLAKLLADPDLMVRLTAINAVDIWNIHLIDDKFNDPDPVIRRAAIATVVGFNRKPELAILFTNVLSNETDKHVLMYVINSLHLLNTDTLPSLVSMVLSDTNRFDAEMRRSALAEAVMDTGRYYDFDRIDVNDKIWLCSLAAKDPDKDVRSNAFEIIVKSYANQGDVGPQTQSRFMRLMLEDPSSDIVKKGISKFGQTFKYNYNSEGVYEVEDVIFNNPDEDVRAFLFKKTSSYDDVPALGLRNSTLDKYLDLEFVQRALEDPSPKVRAAAYGYLGGRINAYGNWQKKEELETIIERFSGREDASLKMIVEDAREELENMDSASKSR